MFTSHRKRGLHPSTIVSQYFTLPLHFIGMPNIWSQPKKKHIIGTINTTLTCNYVHVYMVKHQSKPWQYAFCSVLWHNPSPKQVCTTKGGVYSLLWYVHINAQKVEITEYFWWLLIQLSRFYYKVWKPFAYIAVSRNPECGIQL